MKRRSFLKWLLGSTALAVVPLPVPQTQGVYWLDYVVQPIEAGEAVGYKGYESMGPALFYCPNVPSEDLVK